MLGFGGLQLACRRGDDAMRGRQHVCRALRSKRQGLGCWMLAGLDGNRFARTFCTMASWSTPEIPGGGGWVGGTSLFVPGRYQNLRDPNSRATLSHLRDGD